MKTIYLHIGTEKTGTKSIQYFLSNSKKLLSKNNIYYPTGMDKCFVHKITHWPLAAAVTNNNQFVAEEKLLDYRELYAKLKEEINEVKEQKIILSAEPFSTNVTNVEDIKKIKDSLSEYNVKVIVYLRRQDHYFVSLTSTKIKGGMYFENYDFKHHEIFNDKDRYDYNILLDKWATVFGKENMLVREYTPKKLLNGSIIDDFSSVVGIERKRLFGKPKQIKLQKNKSLSLECLYFLNDLNRANLIDIVKRTKVFGKLETYEGKYSSKYILNTEKRMEIMEHFQASNDLVNKNYFNNERMFDLSDLHVDGNFELNEEVGFDDYTKIMNFLMEKEIVREIMVEHYVNSLEKIKTMGEHKQTLRDCLYIMCSKPQHWSEDIASLEYEKNALTFKSTGLDPYFIFDNFNNENFTSIEIDINIETSAPSFVQVFYTSQNEGFSPEKTETMLIYPSMQEYKITIDNDVVIKNLRFDIGDTVGEYKINKIKIYGK